MAPAHAFLVSHKHPLPTDDGKKAVLAGLVAYLVARYGADGVTCVVVGRPPQAPAQVPALPCAVQWIRPPGRLRQAVNALASLAGLSRRSLQEALTWSPRVARELRALAATRPTRLLLLDTVRIGQHLEQPLPGAPRRVLYMDDLFHLRFERLAALAAAMPAGTMAPAGTFGAQLPRAAARLLAWPPLRDALYRFETRKVRARELRAPALFDRSLLINPNEAALLAAQCKGRQPGAASRVATMPPLLFTAPPPLRRFDGAPRFVLFGSLRHPTWRVSVQQLLGPAGDAVFAALPQAQLLLIGDGLDDALAALASTRPQVQALGFVGDVAPLLAGACAMLVPSLAPGGLRLKALTAMFHGLPIVATAAAVDGLALVDGESYLRQDRIEAYAEPMQRLLDPAFNARIAAAARSTFERQFGREAVFASYDALFGGDRSHP